MGLTVLLLCAVYTETGVWTTTALGLIAVTVELVIFLLPGGRLK